MAGNDRTSWRRSTRCEAGTCVEVAHDGQSIRVRDSKNPDSELTFSMGEWAGFVGELKDGTLIRPE